MLKSACTVLLVLGVAMMVAPMAPAAQAANDDPECAALAVSVLPAPDWYAERCLGGAAVTDYSQYRELPWLVPGDTAFYKINFPAPLDVRTAPLATLTFTTVGANAQPLFAMTFDLAAATLYASTTPAASSAP